MQRVWKAITIVLGITMLAMGGWLMYLNPSLQEAGPLPQGFMTPIIALEFMPDLPSLIAFFDHPNQSLLREKLHLANIYDYGFMVLYSLFAFCCGILMFLETRIKSIFFSAIPCVLMLAADGMENLYIGALTALDNLEGATPLLHQLQFYTWLKWGSISALFLMYSVYFLQGNWWKITIGILLLVVFVLYAAAFFLRGFWQEWMSLSVLAGFLLLFAFSIFWRPVIVRE